MRFDLDFDQGVLPDDWMPLEAVIVVKGIPVDGGGVQMFHTATKGLTSWEALGMVNVAADELLTLLRGDQ